MTPVEARAFDQRLAQHTTALIAAETRLQALHAALRGEETPWCNPNPSETF